MISPEGYRPFMEFAMLAHKVAEAIENESFDAALDSISFPEGSQERYKALQSIVSDSSINCLSSKYKMIDTYIFALPRIYVCSPMGNVLELSKRIVLPDSRFYEDDKVYVENFDCQYECVDTFLWIIDCQKLEEYRQRLRELVEPNVEAGAATYTEHPRYADKLRKLDGWSLCVREADFPKNAQSLRQSSQESKPARSDATTIVKRILSIAQTDCVTKTSVRNLFPHLSARQFEHYWRLAAEKNPTLSKPGRKS